MPTSKSPKANQQAQLKPPPLTLAPSVALSAPQPGNRPPPHSLFGVSSAKTRYRRDQLPSNAVCISKSDYEKMKVRSILRTQADEEAELARIEAIRAEKEQVSRARKARMMAMEDEAKKKAKKSASEEVREGGEGTLHLPAHYHPWPPYLTLSNLPAQISEQRAQAIRKQAMEKIDQQNDLVKLLNTYSQRAMAFTIRDQQMADKKRRDAMEAEYEKRMDIAMEIDR